MTPELESKAAILLTTWIHVKRSTVSIEKTLYDQLGIRTKPKFVGATAEGKVELVVLDKQKAIEDLKSRYRLFEASDYDSICRDSAGEQRVRV